MGSEQVLEEEFSSDEEFVEDDDSESSTDVDAKLAEDEVFDIEFLKCYAALKKKDEKIYDTNIQFFNKDDQANSNDKGGQDAEKDEEDSKSKAPKMTLMDYQLALAKGEIEEPELSKGTNRQVSQSYYEKELNEIKNSIQKQSKDIDSDSDDDLLVVKGSKEGEAPARPTKRITALLDKTQDPDVAHLKELWNDPDKLTEEDKFLRDFIVNKRYLPSNTTGNDGSNPFFSKNIDELSDVEADDAEVQKKIYKVDEHSEIARVPRNSTKTIRDLVEKQRKKEKRLKRVIKKKKRKNLLKDADCEDIIDDLPIKFHYKEVEPQDNNLTAEELLMATDDEEIEDKTPTEESKSSKRKKKHKRGLNHKKFAKTGVAPDRLLAYGLSKTKLKKSKLL